MTRGHLGDRAAAFVDGALGPRDCDRVVAHLVQCAACRADVAEQRRVKSLLAGLQPPSVPPDLAARLRAVADSPVPSPWVPAWEPVASSGTAPAAAARPGPGNVGRRRARRRAAVAAGASGLAAAAVLAAAAGASGTAAVATPTVTPPVQRFAAAHAAVAGELPLSAPGLRLAPAGVTGVTGGLAPGLAAAPGTVTWALPAGPVPPRAPASSR